MNHTMEVITYREALKRGLHQALQENEKVFLVGEDVGRYGGSFAVSKGMLQEFGPDRIMDVPLSEAGFTGAGIGAAIGGMRPIVEIMTVNFSLLAMDQIINNAATLLHMSGGQVRVPLIIRMSCGIGKQLAAQHSHSWESFYAHVPGLKVLSAGTHRDARTMLPAALNENGPVIIFEYTNLLNMENTVAEEDRKNDISKAAVLKEGKDISIFTYGGSVYKCLEAAEKLTASNIDAEIVDLRILRPLDEESIVKSVSKCHRALVVEEGWRSVSISSEVIARINEKAFYELDAPIRRICGMEVPIPYPKHLEDASVPQVTDIVNGVRKIVGR